MKTTTRALAVAVLALATALPQAGQAADAATVVARVGDTEITLGHVAAVMRRLPEQYRQMPDEMLFQGILDQLVDQTAVKQQVPEPLPLRVQVDIDNGLREVVVNDALSRLVSGAVTEEALRSLYEERYLGAEPAMEYNAAHILVDSEDLARDLAEQLDGGADFADLAREHSNDPGSAARGGDLGWFGLGRMVPQFEEAVVSLSTGETSAPVQTQFGWHLIRLADTRSAEAPPFEAVRDELAGNLQQQVVMDHIAAAREAAEIEIMAEGIDPAIIRDQTLLDD